jgi:ankyrin repeat protein
MDENGDTALHLAAKQGKTEWVTLLLEYGALQFPNDAGQTPLQLANNEECIKRLKSTVSFSQAASIFAVVNEKAQSDPLANPIPANYTKQNGSPIRLVL